MDRLRMNKLQPLEKERISQGARLVMGTIGNLDGTAERLEAEFPKVEPSRLATIKNQMNQLQSSLTSLLEQDAGKTLSEVKDSLGAQSGNRSTAQANRECKD